jgi:quercetin dioxygenase-like cupin family protein
MKVPNADFLERTRSEILGARLWRLPSGSANTLHKHHRAEEFHFVEGTVRIRVEGQTLTVLQHGGVLIGPRQLRQVFNDTQSDVLWLIVGAPEAEFLPPNHRTCRFIIRLTRSNCPRNWRARNGRPKRELSFMLSFARATPSS